MTELRLPDLEDLKKQSEEFHLTILTRLARMHHLLEDIQDRLHYLHLRQEGATLPLPTGLPGKENPNQ